MMCTKSCPDLVHCSHLHTRKWMSREAGCDPQGHRVSQNQGINGRNSALQILRTLCITRCESVSCSVMSNPLQLSVCFRETRVWKKKKIQLWVDGPLTRGFTCHSVAWGLCRWITAHESTGLGEELLLQTVGMSFSHTACLNLELPDGACSNHRKARLSPGYFRSRGELK